MRKSTESSADVAVVGGGVAGLSAARELGRRGLGVVIIESGLPGESSHAASVMVAASADAFGARGLRDTEALGVRVVAGRAAGVETPRGFVSAGAVVLAAGARTSRVPLVVSEREGAQAREEFDSHPSVEPVRGQMLC